MSEDSKSTGAYRDEFADARRAERYDEHEYGVSSWSSLLWNLERDFLQAALDNPVFVPNRARYLDFACGTGRVTELIGQSFAETVGVDISEAMLERARKRLPHGIFIAGDIVDQPHLVRGPFDLVSMFRFVLNADPQDRAAALAWARTLMRDDASRLVVNNHANLWTHKAIPHVVRKLRHPRRPVTGNVLTHRQMVGLATSAGFTVESVHGLGHFGGHVQSLIGFERMSRLQRVLSGRPGIQRLGEDQIYVLSPN